MSNNLNPRCAHAPETTCIWCGGIPAEMIDDFQFLTRISGQSLAKAMRKVLKKHRDPRCDCDEPCDPFFPFPSGCTECDMMHGTGEHQPLGIIEAKAELGLEPDGPPIPLIPPGFTYEPIQPTEAEQKFLAERAAATCTVCGLLPRMAHRQECLLCILKVREKPDDSEAPGVGDS